MAATSVPVSPYSKKPPIRTPSMMISSEWSEVQQNIGTLVSDHQNNRPINAQDFPFIKKSHWTPSGDVTNCSICRKKFGLTDRKHHCYRCGQVCCWKCTRYKRKLSILAEPDPNGRSYQVCASCFDEGPQTIGQTHDLTDLFYTLIMKGRKTSPKYKPRSGTRLHRKLDYHKECRRLTEGFLAAGGTSWLKSASLEIMKNFSLPDWQKGTFYLPKGATDFCQLCEQKFGLLKQKHNCRVCGRVICASCSAENLILYVPDDGEQDSDPHWAIIKVKGCPEVEPNLCLYQRVCGSCQAQLEDIQLEQVTQAVVEEEQQDIFSSIKQVYEKISATQSKVDTQLPKYQELIEGLEISAGSPKYLPQARSNMQMLAKAQADLSDHLTRLVVEARSNMQMLAKAQADLSDHLTRLVVEVSSLKRLQPSTAAQLKLLKGLLRAKYEFYQENMFQFRDLRRRLEAMTPTEVRLEAMTPTEVRLEAMTPTEVRLEAMTPEVRLEAMTPTEVLNEIQAIVDHQAINSAYISTKQLGLEALLLADKHQFPPRIAQVLASVEGVVMEELQISIQEHREDWEQHQLQVQEFVKRCLQGSSHRFVRPSRRLTKAHGTKYVSQFLTERSEIVVTQIYLQLCAKCVDKKFKKTKESLKAAQLQLVENQEKGQRSTTVGTESTTS
ncbi:FGD4 [Branchiostoma lanceolatum]|uniref:FGD4 protein n=1 Tax=Branchiostoma lanceolatum TaxID=7740 RepID=A0A8J9WGM6_BRALA|nr:FGD4 [Branchiostoma lanceolatum]